MNNQFFFQKSRQEADVSVSRSQEGMESHGRINFGQLHSSSLSQAGSSGRFESVIKGYSRTLCQIMEAGKRAPHTQTPPRSATGQVPAFHLAALPRVRRWSRWSRLYGVWVPSHPAISLAPKDHLTRVCDLVRPASSQVQGHPPHRWDRTSASWAFRSNGKRANACRCRGSLFSVWSLGSVNQTDGVELLEYVQ